MLSMMRDTFFDWQEETGNGRDENDWMVLQVKGQCLKPRNKRSMQTKNPFLSPWFYVTSTRMTRITIFFSSESTGMARGLPSS